MSTPHQELDLRALLKLGDNALELALRQRIAACGSKSDASLSGKYLFLQSSNTLDSPSKDSGQWGTILNDLYFSCKGQFILLQG